MTRDLRGPFGGLIILGLDACIFAAFGHYVGAGLVASVIAVMVWS